MAVINVLVGLTAIVWVVIGIRTHANWIENVFKQESQKINQQQNAIERFGYGAVSNTNKLTLKKGFVFGYWGNNDSGLSNERSVTIEKSPVIFKAVNASLIMITSCALLIVFSKGFLTGIGVYG